MPCPGCSLPAQPFSSSAICVILALTERKSPDSGGARMTFDEILAQVLELLQREQRVSYRALKLRFDINDDYIEGIKDELIYAKKLAVDEENRVLVWTGNIAGTIDTPSPLPQSIPLPPTQDTSSVPPASPGISSRTPEAERRQLTVMFCDLVG